MSACPHCGQDGEVKDSREREGWRYRRRACPTHGPYSTIEVSTEEMGALRAILHLTKAERGKIARALVILDRVVGKK